MKIKSNRNVGKYQEGGAVPMGGGMPPEAAGGMPPEGAMPPEGGGAPAGGDPMQEIMMLSQQALETQDCEAAMQVCEILMQALGGGGAPPAGGEGMPAAPPVEEQPVFGEGGRIRARKYGR